MFCYEQYDTDELSDVSSVQCLFILFAAVRSGLYDIKFPSVIPILISPSTSSIVEYITCIELKYLKPMSHAAREVKSLVCQ